MNRALCFCLLLLPGVMRAGTFHCTWQFSDFASGSLGIKQVQIATLAPYGVNSNTIITRDIRSYQTSTNSSLTVSNLVNGRSYRVQFFGLTTPYGTNVVTTITNNFDTNVTGLVNAVDYLAAPLQVDSATVAYSQAAADARFLRRTNDTGTNMTLRGTTTFPGTSTSGKVWTATNDTGAGYWAAAAAGGSGKEVAAGNNVTATTNGGNTLVTLSADVSLAALAAKVSTNDSANLTLSGSNFWSGQQRFTSGITYTGAETNTSLLSGIIGADSNGKRKIVSLSGLTFDGATLTATAAGGGIGTLSGTGTNTTLKTTDNTSTPDGAALILRPMVIGSGPASAASLLEMWPAITNGAYFPRQRFVSTSAAQSYGSDQPDINFSELLNYGGNSAGSSSYGPTTTNYPGWIHQKEFKWQNNAIITAFEDWHGWHTPYTQWGTNFNFRFMGFDLFWNTADGTYNSSDGNITVDSFNFFSPRSSVGSINFLPAQTDYGPSFMYIYGTVIARTNSSGGSGFITEGGNFQAKVATGFTPASTTQIGMDWNNNIGVRPHFYIYHFGGPAAFIVNGFTNLDISTSRVELSNNVAFVVGGAQTNKSVVLFTNAASADSYTWRWNPTTGTTRWTNPASASTFVSVSPAGITNSSLTASRAMVTDANGAESSSAVTATELGYVSGVTSALQTQLDAKVPATAFNANQFSVGGTKTNIISGASVTNLNHWQAFQLRAGTSGDDVQFTSYDFAVLGLDSGSDPWATPVFIGSTGAVFAAVHAAGKLGSGALTASRVVVSDSNKDLASVADSGINPINSAGTAALNGQNITNVTFPANTITMADTNAAMLSNVVSYISVSTNLLITNWPAMAVNGTWGRTILTNAFDKHYYVNVPTNLMKAALTNATGSFVQLDPTTGTNWQCVLSNGSTAELVWHFWGGNINSGHAYYRWWGLSR